MVMATDHPKKPQSLGAREGRSEQPRFSLFAALAAPFKDIDDRALYQKLATANARNNSKKQFVGHMGHGAPKVPLRPFARGD